VLRKAVLPGTISRGEDTLAHVDPYQETSMLQIGDLAPDFVARGARGDEVRLSDLRGAMNVVLLFYPKDMTTG